MVPSEQGYVPRKDYLASQMARMPEFSSPEMPEYDLVEFDPLLDSSNMSVREWNQIGAAIRERYFDYDGFVVLHGTDTMAYTASALSFMLEGLEKPVVLTGSQIPFCELRSDARDNLTTAVMIAAQGQVPEVCLYFSGRLLRGNRATKLSADELIAFDSPNYPALAKAGVRITLSPQNIRPRGTELRVHLFQPVQIAVLKVFPGIRFEVFENLVTSGVKGIVLEAFVLCTGFDEFEYAKEAVHLEIKEYMLKPISATELSESLMKLKATLDREREEKLNVKKLEDYFQEVLPKLQSNFFISLIEGRVREEDYERFLLDYQVDMKGPLFSNT